MISKGLKSRSLRKGKLIVEKSLLAIALRATVSGDYAKGYFLGLEPALTEHYLIHRKYRNLKILYGLRGCGVAHIGSL